MIGSRRIARWEAVLLACILSAHLAALVYLAWRTGVTVDEPAHLLSSCLYWHGRDHLKPRDMPPMIKIAGGWVPRLTGLPVPYDHPSWNLRHEWSISLEMMDRLRERIPRVFFLSRLPLLVFPLLTGALLWWWARRIFAPATALLILAAFVLEPTALGHGALFKNDLAATFGYLLFWYRAWVYWRDPRKRNAAWLGVGLLFAILAKLSMLILLAIGPAVVIARHLTLAPKRLRAIAAGLILVLAIPYLGSIAACQFDASRLRAWDLRVLDRDPRVWDAFLAAAKVFLVLPLPDLMWDGTVSLMQVSGERQSIFLLGRNLDRSSPFYFLVALALKAPVPLQLLFAGALLLEALALRRREFDNRRLFWIVPGWIYIGLASLASFQLGVRLVLPALPLVLLTCGGALEWLLRGRRATVLAGLFTVLAVRTVWIYPHPISFFNLWPGTPANGARLLSDSNVDWGQDLRELAAVVHDMGIRGVRVAYFGTDCVWAYLDEREAVLLAAPWSDDLARGEVYQPEPGYYAISAALLPGHMFADRYQRYFSAFWDLKPVAQAGHSIYLYKVEEPRADPPGG